MDSESLIRNTNGIPNTHYFVYKNKKYPIKYDFFKYSSNYFQQHHKKIKKTENIQLLDEESEKTHELSDDTINSFINFIQCNDIKLTPENVVDLNYLSTLYEVPTLKKHTEDYISKNHSQVAVQLLQRLDKSDVISSSTYEEIISDSLEDYLNDNRLLSLHIPILYRILCRYRLKNLNKQTKKEVIDFIFKVFQKNGRSASILFSEIDFGDSRIEYINRLLTEFSNEFDFHFINSSLLQTLYEVNNQLIMNEEKHRREIDELTQKMNEKIQRIEKKSADELNRQKEETNELVQKIRNELLGEIQKLKKEVGENKNSCVEILNKETSSRETGDRLIQKEITGIKDELDAIKKIVENKQKQTEGNEVELLHKQDFNGIIKYLTDKEGGNIHDKQVIEVSSNSFWSGDDPKNLLDFNCRNYYRAQGKNDSWVCFDFKDMRVKITNYSIKSYNYPEHHLRSWIFEVSNDGQSWTSIDEHQNCSTLKGSGYVGTFSVRSNDFSRYVRLHQTDVPWGGHNLWFHYLELYGYLRE